MRGRKRLEAPIGFSKRRRVAELLSVPVNWVREQTRAGNLPHVALASYRRYLDLVGEESEVALAFVAGELIGGGD
jgi:hypothetical protein